MVSGWFPLGLCGGAEPLITALRQLKGVVDFNQSLALQEGAIAALSQAPDWPQRLLPVYRERRDRTSGVGPPGLAGPDPFDGPVSWLPLPGWARERGWRRTVDRCSAGADGSGPDPGSGFGAGGQDWMRMALVRPIEELEAAVARLEPFWQQQC